MVKKAIECYNIKLNNNSNNCPTKVYNWSNIVKTNNEFYIYIDKKIINLDDYTDLTYNLFPPPNVPLENTTSQLEREEMDSSEPEEPFVVVNNNRRRNFKIQATTNTGTQNISHNSGATHGGSTGNVPLRIRGPVAAQNRGSSGNHDRGQYRGRGQGRGQSRGRGQTRGQSRGRGQQRGRSRARGQYRGGRSTGYDEQPYRGRSTGYDEQPHRGRQVFPTVNQQWRPR